MITIYLVSGQKLHLFSTNVLKNIVSLAFIYENIVSIKFKHEYENASTNLKKNQCKQEKKYNGQRAR